MYDKKPSTFSKITKVVVWVMLISIIGSAVIGGVMMLF
ncbi:DUF4044 domain-containing protein [Vagococcus intermedius]|uniref:DUF4044 domain-containing protein n=1 Tax=Vagococcus intermedius TaxID=2991418 RepID=A0AAF0CVP5_9ENTE|nr:DUF4044 domain-containing protein [Vagococcus intermedius]WEG73850.1 DUF4044 domain-containing protein [Vagococcus intermedius]WEG75935.1 DUF4044 domain-containing protein [Vagococcus intermedius]